VANGSDVGELLGDDELGARSMSNLLLVNLLKKIIFN
jgi:hypothetical protein